jgi:hypothetical protein
MKRLLYETLISLSLLLHCAFLTQPQKKQVENLMDSLKKAIMNGADE